MPTLSGSETVHMARPLDPANLDKAISLYLAGEPFLQIAAATGVSASAFHRERCRRGIPPRKRKGLPVDEIVAAYAEGVSSLELSEKYCVSRQAINDRLRQAGMPIRGRSQAGLVRAAKMTPEQRQAQAADAHEAVRGRNASVIELRRRALQIEARGASDSPGEERLREELLKRGIHAQPQRAIGKYNVDLAVAPVAVEVLGGGWHSYKPRHIERTPYILDEGWHLAMVWDFEGRSALGEGAAEYLVSFIEEMRRNPPATCQYRVITGQGEVLATCGREDGEFPLVPPPRGRL